MEIKSLNKTNFDTIFNAFSQAFADYELQLNRPQLETMLKRRGFNPELSFGAFDKNEIVSFTFNGIGIFNGIFTAYDTGTGTLPSYRGQGLATKIFEHSIPFLREKGVKQYLLEVLQHNTKAVSVYKNIGFEATREFNYFMQETQKIKNNTEHSSASCRVKQINIDTLHSLSDFQDFYPSWQNSFESIKRAESDFICLGVYYNGKIAGYCVFEPASGDITQIAIEKQNRRKGMATLLLKKIMELNKSNNIKIVNTDISCESITNFLEAKNILIKGRQFEMIKKI